MRSLSLAVLLLACLAAIISRESPVQAVPRIRPAILQHGMPFGKRGYSGNNAKDCFHRALNDDKNSEELVNLIEAWYRMKVEDGLSCMNGLSAFDEAAA